MIVYIKRFSDYRTAKKAVATSWSLVLDSLDAEGSTVTVAGTEVDRSDTGNWLIADGQIFRISGVKPETEQTVLTLEHPLEAFKRPLEFSEQPNNQTVGGFISQQLDRHWRAEDDPVYAVPYLITSNSDTMPFVAPELDSGGCFSLPEYCRLMRKAYQVEVIFSDNGRNLSCQIVTQPAAFRQIAFDDGHSTLQSVAYAFSGYAKITALHDVNTGEKDENGNAVLLRERTNWYLSETGEISQLIPEERAPGDWGTLHVPANADVRTKVIEAFAKNKANHKLEFWSTRELPVQTVCNFLVNGQLLRSYISYKRKSSADNRFYYKSGELATTASEKLKGVLK